MKRTHKWQLLRYLKIVESQAKKNGWKNTYKREKLEELKIQKQHDKKKSVNGLSVHRSVSSLYYLLDLIEKRSRNDI